VHYNGNGTDTIVDPYHGPIYINFVGNYWKQGLDGPVTQPLNQNQANIRIVYGLTYSSTSAVYVHDNIGRYFPTPCFGCNVVWGQAVPDSSILWMDNGPFDVRSVPFAYPPITTTSAAQAYVDVLNGAGAFPRDAVDIRVVADVINGTGHWITDPADVGGWPVLTSATPPAGGG
jgi:hypothetical protein